MYPYHSTSCGGYYTEEGSILSSPGFPGVYAHSVYCIYDVVAPEENVITLTFDFFDVQGVDNSGVNYCYYDYVEVRDGNAITSPLLAKKCGPQTPQPIQGTQQFMWILFKTDASINGDGWRAMISFDEVGPCGGVLTERKK